MACCIPYVVPISPPTSDNAIKLTAMTAPLFRRTNFRTRYVALGGPELDQGQAMSTFRRSVFYRHANEKQAPFLVIFDGASVNECYRRPASIAPQQALALANSPLTQNASRTLAQSLDKEAGTTADEAFVDIAFRHILNRVPTADEQRECLSYLSSRKKSAADAQLKARSSLVHVLFNHHDFVTIR
jgi:hypothetical protein